MAKQQTLTIIVDDDMADPRELVERALERYLLCGPVRPECDDLLAHRFDDDNRAYLILEED